MIQPQYTLFIDGSMADWERIEITNRGETLVVYLADDQILIADHPSWIIVGNECYVSTTGPILPRDTNLRIDPLDIR